MRDEVVVHDALAANVKCESENARRTWVSLK